MASNKEIKSYRVDQKERTVKVYVSSLNETEQSQVEFYGKMGYKIIALDKEKPKSRAKTSISKNDMRKYLKGKIDNNIYNNLLTHLKSEENFFETKSWLKEELQKNAKRNNKKYVPFNTIIAIEKENEKIEIESNVKDYESKNRITKDSKEETTEEE